MILLRRFFALDCGSGNNRYSGSDSYDFLGDIQALRCLLFRSARDRRQTSVLVEIDLTVLRAGR
jgi:hypothetical protein